MHQISPLRDWADLRFTMCQISPRADLALEWADLGFPMYQISPRADLALEWADLGFTLCQISPLQQLNYLFPKPQIRQDCCLNQ